MVDFSVSDIPKVGQLRDKLLELLSSTYKWAVETIKHQGSFPNRRLAGIDEDEREDNLREAVTKLQSALRSLLLRRIFEGTWFGQPILDLPHSTTEVQICGDGRQLQRVEEQNNHIRKPDLLC